MRWNTMFGLVSLIILSLVAYQAEAAEIGWEAEKSTQKNGDGIQVLKPPFNTTNSDGVAFEIAEASGGAFIGEPNGGIADSSGSWLKYAFSAPVAGDWYFWGRVIAPTGADNSFFWNIDIADADATPASPPNNIQDFNEQGNFPFGEGNEGDRTKWAWFRFSSRTGPFPNFPGVSYTDPTPLPLTASAHTLHIIHREGGAFLDRIFATTDKALDANKTTPTPVEPKGKLATTWGNLKQER